MVSIPVNGEFSSSINFTAENTGRIGDVHIIQRQIRRIVIISDNSDGAIILQIQIFPIKGYRVITIGANDSEQWIVFRAVLQRAMASILHQVTVVRIIAEITFRAR